ILLVLAVGGSAGPTALPVETRLAMVRSATQLGLLTTGLLALSLALRIQAQSYAVFGEGVSGESFRALTSTGWGIAWIVQVVGAVLALAGFLLAMRQMQPGLALA